MGYNINGIIAGLGLSGLTLSLAAQNTASNLFSGFEIITDKPFDVGDYIATASAEGFVEDITMRSTRVRTRDDLVVTIPNATLMKEAITNYSRTQLGKAVTFPVSLTYDTTTEQLQRICGDIRKYLEDSDDVDNSIISVTFKDFGDSSQDLEVTYFTVTTDKYENLKVREDVNFAIRRIVEEADPAHRRRSRRVLRLPDDHGPRGKKLNSITMSVGCHNRTGAYSGGVGIQPLARSGPYDRRRISVLLLL